jgi:A/G-specific adenine glycosylase
VNGAVLMDFPAGFPRQLCQALLAWFRRSGRDLPWRRNRDPYSIWVSEIMLQQTQVATVIPFFKRFLEAFPTLAHLASAPEQAVLKHWEGLGYYRRARNLHRAAQQILGIHRGQIPNDAALLSQLPGIGRYTMGAILSQAFDRRLPILEANSRRVLCRLFARSEDPRQNPLRAWLWDAAEALLPTRGSGEFNQALMELGALVCTPVAPSCSHCPVRKFCKGRKLGLQKEIPRRKSAPRPLAVQETAVVVRRGKKVLLVQRPGQGRWAGLWEFPHGPIVEGATNEQAAVLMVRELTSIKINLGREILTQRHAVTHHRITLVCFLASYDNGMFSSSFYAKARWLYPAQLTDFPVSAPQRRLAQLLVDPGMHSQASEASPLTSCSNP